MSAGRKIICKRTLTSLLVVNQFNRLMVSTIFSSTNFVELIVLGPILVFLNNSMSYLRINSFFTENIIVKKIQTKFHISLRYQSHIEKLLVVF